MNREVGMYVRYKPLLSSKYVKINKIKEIEEKENCLHIWLEDKDLITEKYLIKASYNIIDILEKGDYVNGDKIEYIDDCEGAMREFYYDYENPNDDVGHWQEEIKTIITHEQMEQMEYKVGE